MKKRVQQPSRLERKMNVIAIGALILSAVLGITGAVIGIQWRQTTTEIGAPNELVPQGLTIVPPGMTLFGTRVAMGPNGVPRESAVCRILRFWTPHVTQDSTNPSRPMARIALEKELLDFAGGWSRFDVVGAWLNGKNQEREEGHIYEIFLTQDCGKSPRYRLFKSKLTEIMTGTKNGFGQMEFHIIEASFATDAAKNK